MNVREIVVKFLEEGNYDGLFVPGECACKKDDLFPCGETCADCEPGYLSPARHCSEHEWHIGPKGEGSCGESCND